jgi:type II secretory pathway pseudopilin PulG
MRHNERGFTLVEAIVALTVTVLVVFIITNFALNNLYASTQANARATILQETQQSLDLAANDIRLSANADQNNRWVDANSPGGSSNQFGWQSSGSTLVLATAAQDASGNILFADSKNYVTQKNNIVYFVSNGTLYKRTIAAQVSGNAAKTTCPAALATTACPADKAILHNVTTFGVSYINGQNQSVLPTNARSIELHVIVTKRVYGQDLTSDYKTRMVFRND